MKIIINQGTEFGISLLALKKLSEMDSECIRIVDVDKEVAQEFTIKMGNGFMASKEDMYRYCLYKDGKIYELKDDDEVRAHPDLIDIVEKLGQKSWGEYARLKIIEIPDDVNWTIDRDMTGAERIIDKDRIWQ